MLPLLIIILPPVYNIFRKITNNIYIGKYWVYTVRRWVCDKLKKHLYQHNILVNLFIWFVKLFKHVNCSSTLFFFYYYYSTEQFLSDIRSKLVYKSNIFKSGICFIRFCIDVVFNVWTKMNTISAKTE